MEIKKTVESERIKFLVRVDKDAWHDAQNKAFQQLSHEIKIPGFRNNHIPLPVLKKHIKQSFIFKKASHIVTNEIYSKLLKMPELDNEPLIIDSVTTSINEINEDIISILYDFEKYPEIILPDYKQIKLDKTPITISPNEIKREIYKLTKEWIIWSPKINGVVEYGDLINFNLKSFYNKQICTELTKDFIEVEIGSQKYIPGFEEKIIGLQIHKKHLFSLLLPHDYKLTNYASKTIEFEIFINDIKTPSLPELNNDFVKSLNIPNVQTSNQLESYVHDLLSSSKTNKRYLEQVKTISNFLIQNTKISHYPYDVVHSGVDNEIKAILLDAKRNNTNINEYILKKIGFKTLEEYKRVLTNKIEQNILLSLSLEKIAGQLNVTVSNDEIDNNVAEINAMTKQKIESPEKIYDQNKSYLLHKKTFDALIKILL